MPTSRSFVIYCQIAFFAASPNGVLAQAGTAPRRPRQQRKRQPSLLMGIRPKPFSASRCKAQQVRIWAASSMSSSIAAGWCRPPSSISAAFWASAPERSRLTGMRCTFRKRAVWKSSLPLCRQINCERRPSSRRANLSSSWAGRTPRLLPPHARLLRLPRLRLPRRRRTLRRPSPDGVGAMRLSMAPSIADAGT